MWDERKWDKCEAIDSIWVPKEKAIRGRVIVTRSYKKRTREEREGNS